MAQPSTVVPPGGLVLVTGATGFIASHIVSALLQRGYRVRGTVRSPEKAAWITSAMLSRHPNASSFTTSIVPDQTAPDAWDSVVSDVDGIVHVAGDMSFSSDPSKVIPPMLTSLRRLLELAAKEPSVRRFVFTSSNQAALYRTFGKKFMVHTGMWNDLAIERAWKKDPPIENEEEKIWDVYSALKTQCEKECWRFKEEEKPGFVVNSVLPCFVIGPTVHREQSGSTGKWVLDFWRDEGHFAPLKGFGASYFVDAEDTALLHLVGLMEEDVKEERLLGFAETFNFNSWVRVFSEMDGGRKWPEEDPEQKRDLSRIDGRREVELLRRFGRDGWMRFEESVKRTCRESPL